MTSAVSPGKAIRRAGERFLIRTILFSQRRELDYHPLPFSGDGGPSKRGDGSRSRLEAINAVVRSESVSPRIALDIGSHIGFFAISLAKQGMFVHAVESNWDRLLLSFLLAREEKVPLSPIPMRIDTGTVDLLPESDVTLCLSVWHHWVRCYGLDDATYILQVIVKKTRHLVFFDSGEEEMSPRYGLPYGDQSSKDFFARYLQQLEGVDALLDLGRHQAISPTDETGVRHDVLRTLYGLRKIARAFD